MWSLIFFFFSPTFLPPISCRIPGCHMRAEGRPVRLQPLSQQRDLLRPGPRAPGVRLQLHSGFHRSHVCPAGGLLRPEPLRSRRLPQCGQQLPLPVCPRWAAGVRLSSNCGCEGSGRCRPLTCERCGHWGLNLDKVTQRLLSSPHFACLYVTTSLWIAEM